LAGEQMIVFFCATFFGLERCSVGDEFGVEGYEEFGVQLCMEVKIRSADVIDMQN
jgi:hypothetical protein